MNSKGKKRLIGQNNFSKTKLSKKSYTVSINDSYFKSDFISEFSEAISQKNDIEFQSGAQFCSEPFPCGVLPNFLNSDVFIENLKQNLGELNMFPKNSDLFQFKQSGDLASSTLPAIQKLTKILYEDCLPLMEKITNISLTNEVDMTCSIYDYTDVLLCHDDMLKGRRIAYIYYLVPDWDAADGGALDIFRSEKGNATEIVRSLVPVSNNFVFFEVSPASFHQVSEVLKDKRRLSINGWFHSPSYKMKLIPEKQDKILLSPQPLHDLNITDWINPLYFQAKTIIQIRNTFAEMSEIELQDFLQEEKYREVAIALNSESVKWKTTGPRNKQHFGEATSLPTIVTDCISILHSEEMCLILSNLTGLALHPMAEAESSSSSEDSDSELEATSSKNCSSNSEMAEKNSEEKGTNSIKRAEHQMAKYCSTTRKWTHGCYTLLHDNLMEGKAELDAVLYFNCTDWNSEYGGFTSYVAKGEEDELLRIEPKSNSLALAYTDELTAGFVKYINIRVFDNENSGIFHDILTTYYEHKKD